MNQPIDQHHIHFSEIHPTDSYTQMVPHLQQQGETKPRRRRRKNKRGENGEMGRKKRTLSTEQVIQLEENFENDHKLESERKDRLASELGLHPRQVAVWFQNRRARWKNKNLEQEYSHLKKVHEATVLEKCRLESEVLKLKDKVLEAEKVIQRLLERVEGISSNSSSSSQSMEAIDHPPLLGDFGVEYYDDAFYMPESNYMDGMDWAYQYLWTA